MQRNAERCEIAVKKFATKFGSRVKGCELRALNPLTPKPATPSGTGDSIVKGKGKKGTDKVPAQRVAIGRNCFVRRFSNQGSAMGRDDGSDSPHILFGCNRRRLSLRLFAMLVGDEVVEHSKSIGDDA